MPTSNTEELGRFLKCTVIGRGVFGPCALLFFLRSNFPEKNCSVTWGYRKGFLITCHMQRLWGMYKGSEPMGRLHSVQKHMANVYLPLQFKEVEMFREHTM